MSAPKMQFGLTQREIAQITAVLTQFTQIEDALIFGSRALGTFKTGSDIDMVLKGHDIEDILTHVSYILNEETQLPYFFDVLSYQDISNPDLKNHVDRVGLPIYTKNRHQ